MKTKTTSIRLMNDTLFTEAVKVIFNLIKNDLQTWENEHEQYEIFGTLGNMSPLSRAAFVKEFGEEQTARAEKEARAKLELKENKSCYLSFSKRADSQFGTPEVGEFVWASC